MPTSTGMPRVGEVWKLQITVQGKRGPQDQFVVLERNGSRQDFSMRVYSNSQGRRLMVECAYHLQQGWLTYVGPAGPETKKELGLG